MNNMRNFAVIAIGLAIFLASCSKEKKTLKNISGQWNVTSYEVHGATSTTDVLDQNSIIMDFESCESGSTCNVYSTTTITSLSITTLDTSTYSISENTNAETGFMLVADDTLEYAINELTSSNMRLVSPIGNGGAVAAGTDTEIITLEKL